MSRPKPSDVPAVPLLKLPEAAAIFGVGLRTLQAWRAAGRLRVVALSKRCVRVERAEVERLIRESRS